MLRETYSILEMQFLFVFVFRYDIIQSDSFERRQAFMFGIMKMPSHMRNSLYAK